MSACWLGEELHGVGVCHTDQPEVDALKRVHPVRVRLHHVARRVHLLVHRVQHTLAASSPCRGHTNRVVEVQRAIAAHSGPRTLGADKDDRLPGSHYEVHEVGRVREPARPVCDDDGIDARIIRELLQASSGSQPVLHARPPSSALRRPKILRRHPGEESQLGEVFDPRFRSDGLGARLAAGKIEAGVAVAGDLSAHGHQHDVRQIETGRRKRRYLLGAEGGGAEHRRDSASDAESEHGLALLRIPPTWQGPLSTH